MPRKASVSKQMIINASVDMIKNGEPLNARAVAKKLACSIQPIFYNFASMDDLKKEAAKRILAVFEKYIAEHTQSDKYPPFKATGFAYIGFAKDYPEFFKLLFMALCAKHCAGVKSWCCWTASTVLLEFSTGT